MCSTTDKSSHDGGAARNDPLRYECHKQFGMQLVLVCVCVLSQTEAHTMEVLLLELTLCAIKAGPLGAHTTMLHRQACVCVRVCVCGCVCAGV